MNNTLYNKEYFNRYAKTSGWKVDGLHMADIMYRLIKPKSVLDVGCGAGRILSTLKEKYKCNVKGIDYSPDAFNHANPNISDYLFVEDATSKDFKCDRKYDLVICTEVAEHLENKLALAMIDNLCKSGDTILFSAAIPGQSGTGHINCRPVNYWISEFLNRDYIVHQNMTKTYKQKCIDLNVSFYYSRNGNIFVKQ